jgi:hypothetical protein
MNHQSTAITHRADDSISQLYATKRQEYLTQGYTILTQDELPLSEADWLQIEKAHANLAYLRAAVAETGEATSNLDYFRIKVSYKPEIYNEEIWAPINTPEMYDLYKAITGLHEPYMDRCQAHIYRQNGSLGRHSDISVYRDYLCTALIAISDDYEDGEFIIYNSEESPAYTKPKARSFLLTDSSIDHEVNTVKSGERKNICFFLSEGVCTPD